MHWPCDCCDASSSLRCIAIGSCLTAARGQLRPPSQPLTSNAGAVLLVGNGAGCAGGALGISAASGEGVAGAGGAGAAGQALASSAACREHGSTGAQDLHDSCWSLPSMRCSHLNCSCRPA